MVFDTRQIDFVTAGVSLSFVMEKKDLHLKLFWVIFIQVCFMKVRQQITVGLVDYFHWGKQYGHKDFTAISRLIFKRS
jgi:hypothetical protein